MVVHVALVDLEHVVVDVDDRERHGRALGAELLELQRGHRAGGVLDQDLVDAQPELRARLARPAHQVRVDELRGQRARGGHAHTPVSEHPGRLSAPGERSLELLLEPVRDADHGVDVDAGRDALALQHPGEVLGGEVAVAPGANGQPPAPPTEDSNRVAPASSAASALATAVLRVSWRCTPNGAPVRGGALHAAFTWPGTAMPMVSASISSAAPASAIRASRSSTTPGSTSPSNGQPNATLTVPATVAPSATARSIRPYAASAASSRERFTFARASSPSHDRDVDAAHARRERAVDPARVEHEGGDVGLRGAAVERVQDVLGAGHLRHAVVADEAHRLDAAQPGAGQPAAQLGARLRRQGLALVLARRAARRRTARSRSRDDPLLHEVGPLLGEQAQELVVDDVVVGPATPIPPIEESSSGHRRSSPVRAVYRRSELPARQRPLLRHGRSVHGRGVARVPDADEQDVERAVGAARTAFEGEWGQMTGFQRSRLMHRLADLIERDADRLAELEAVVALLHLP